jgi:NitT/TauT family transport system substrate-binding protein
MVIITASVLLLASSVQAQDTVKLTLFMTFVPNIQFAPVYVALEKYYFQDAGFDVEVEYGDETLGVDLVAANQRQFAVVSGEEVIKARANARPVVYIYEWYQKYPVGIVVAEGSGIESVKDLKGRKVGVPGRFGASYNGLTALLTANGLTESDIDLQEIGFNAPDVFCVGGVEAAVVYINNEPLQIQQRADAGNCGDVKTVKVFPVYEAADMVSNGMITNQQTIAENPDMVQKMVQAFDNGLRDTINNPAEAYMISTQYVENLPFGDTFKSALEDASNQQLGLLVDQPARDAVTESRAELLQELEEQFDADTLVQFRVLLNTIELWDADQLGYSDAASWDVTEKVLMDMKFIPAAIDLSKAFSDDFLPAAE